MKARDATVSKMLDKVQDTVADIGPRLHGLGPEVQSAVLAYLFATFLGGIVGSDAAEYREMIIAEWLVTVRALIQECEKKVLAMVETGGRG